MAARQHAGLVVLGRASTTLSGVAEVSNNEPLKDAAAKTDTLYRSQAEVDPVVDVVRQDVGTLSIHVEAIVTTARALAERLALLGEANTTTQSLGNEATSQTTRYTDQL